MAATPKTVATSPAVTDLGMGDMLKMQLDSELEQRKKKLLQASQGTGATGAMGGLGNQSPATMMLFGGNMGIGQS